MSEPSTDEDVPDAPAPRSRRRTASVYLALAVAGLTAGIVTGRMTGSGSPPQAAIRAGEVLATATPTIAVTTTPPASPTPSPVVTTVKPTPTPTPTRTRPPDYSAIPANALTEKDLDFGFLTAVQKNGTLITISFDRADFLTGKEATKANGGTPPDNDYLIVNTSGLIRRFTVDAKAPLLGVNRLVTTPNGSVQQPLDADAFVANATRALATGLGVPVWVRHTDGATGIGPVTSLAEQYLP